MGATDQDLLDRGDEESLSTYGDLAQRYEEMRGYEIDELLGKECVHLGLPPALLQRDFRSLSGGERTRALIVSLFLRRDCFPLIDEPTNHLDMDGRTLLGQYLARKKGYILISHDRHFLDLYVDHIVSINKADVRVNQGNFSQWQEQMKTEEAFEARRKKRLKREIKSYEQAARQRRTHSENKEKQKIGAADKGAVGQDTKPPN